MKLAQYHFKTGEYLGAIDAVKNIKSKEYMIPPYHTPETPIGELKENEYHAFLDSNGNAPRDYKNGAWLVKEQYVKVTGYNNHTQEPKEFDDKSLVTDDYTLLKPVTQFDEWIDNAWVTNEQAQYEAQVQQVDATRRSLYTNVDALRNEAAMIRMLSTDETKAADEAKALDYDKQAKDLYMKIRDDNPWPTPPTE